MSKANNIKAYIHCKTCGQDIYDVGLTDPHTIRVWCLPCDKLIADFELAEEVPLRCDTCGETHE